MSVRSCSIFERLGGLKNTFMKWLNGDLRSFVFPGEVVYVG